MEQLQPETHLFRFGPLTHKCLCFFSVLLTTSPNRSFKHDHKWAKPPSSARCLVLFPQPKVSSSEMCVHSQRVPESHCCAGQGGCLAQEGAWEPHSKALVPPVLSRERVTVSGFCFRHAEGILNQKLHLFSRCLHSFNGRARYPQTLLPSHSLKWLRQKGTSCNRKSCRRMELSKCKGKFSQSLQI